MNYIYTSLVVLFFMTSQANAQCTCCVGASVGSISTEFTTGKMTLEKGSFKVANFFDFRDFKENHEAHDHHMNEPEMPMGGMEEEIEIEVKNLFIESIKLNYGVSSNFTISANLPFIFLNTGSKFESGLGDATIKGLYSFSNFKPFSLGIIGGLELPTGVQRTDVSNAGSIIMGSGSFDPIFGAKVIKPLGIINMNISGSYKITTNGYQGNNYGNVSTQSISASYLFKNNQVLDSLNKNETKLTLLADIGYYGEWIGAAVEEGERDMNSGYYLGMVFTGIALKYNTWTMPISFSIPVFQEINGEQNKSNYRFKVGISKVFN